MSAEPMITAGLHGGPLKRTKMEVASPMRFPHRRSKPTPEPAPEVRQRAPAPQVEAGPDFSDLEYEARYHRDRAALYRARLHGSKPTSAGRLEELERASAAADERLRTARRVGHR
jgi:hypothetical protein